MKFFMPLGGTLEVTSETPLTFDEEMEINPDKKIEGVIWKIIWNGAALPWCTETKLQAMAIAFGCQYGAMHASYHSKVTLQGIESNA